MTQLLTLNQISKTYHTQQALDKVSFTIKKGEIIGLVGENGAGKTTLLRIISGLIPDYDGRITTSENFRIGSLIESPALQPNLSAHENLTYMALQLNIKNPKKRIADILKLVGLSDVDPKKKSKDFSLGMKQRLAIALAILDQPDFLILDEPVNGLDPVGIKEIRQIIATLRRDYGMTVLVSSHILSELELLVDRYIILAKGKVIQEIDKDKLNHQLEEKLLLKTSHQEKTQHILAELGIASTHHEDYLQLPADSDVMAIVHQLIAHHIDLKEIFKQTISFEDHYFTLINQGD